MEKKSRHSQTTSSAYDIPVTISALEYILKYK